MSEETKTMLFDCRNGCGRKVAAEVPNDEFGRNLFLSVCAPHMICKECAARKADEERQRQAEQRREEFRQSLPSRLEAIGLPARYALDSPPVPFAAEWILANQESNLVLSGITGSGKSTSAGYAARRLTAAGYINIRYYSLRRLLAEWKIAKTSDNTFAAETFVRTLGRLDVLIVDEFINKAAITPSGQELLYELIDGAYNWGQRCRVWLLGNFYKGSVAEMFDDPQPVLRRFRESFVCGLIDGGQVKNINF